MANPDSYKIGLCMAGAVSAGAYTAGVMDYLIEALDAWQQRKDNNVPNTPTHDVEIPVMGGASAGGMTCLITAAALQDTITPVKKAAANLPDEIPGNKFYHSWVDLVSDDMLHVMLDTSDITQQGLKSVLNATFINTIAQRALTAQGNSAPRKYIASDLRVFVTLSNLEGMDYSVNFNSNAKDLSRYVITQHNDYACFRLCETEKDYQHDGWIPLNFKSGLNTAAAQKAAMGTGAFPVGLEARELEREGKYLNDNAWFDVITKKGGKPFAAGTYKSVNVDGGMINNEPFEKVRGLLKEITGQYHAAEYEDYNRTRGTVLMIDPFPSEKYKNIQQGKKFNPSTQLTTIMGNTLGALVDQARVKPENMVDVMNSSLAGQYLIAPTRKSNGVPLEGSEAIACGALDGFGGFVHKEFRIHDYFLGRANCEKFLRDQFTVPVDTTNPIFKNGYDKVSDKSAFLSADGKSLQIIPLFEPEGEHMYMPAFSNGGRYPTVSAHYVSGYEKALRRRVEKVLLNFSDYSKTQKFLLWVGAKVVLNNKIAGTVQKKVLDSLREHGLLA